MKKLLRTLAAALFGVLLMGSGASAQTITNGNGTDSTNTIRHNNSTRVTNTCNNTTSVSSTNNQTSSSGNANANGNTTVGNVTSGSASNSNTSAISVASGCGVVLAGTTTTPTVNSSTTSGGQGAAVVLADGTEVKALPATGATAPAEVIAGTIALLSSLALLAKFGNNFRYELAL